MADIPLAGGRAYPGKADFFGSNGTLMKVGDAFLQGTGVNVPDHVDKVEKELTFPTVGSSQAKDNQLYGT